MNDDRRSSPAAARNVGPIIGVLEDWLPETGLVLEIASGTGEHAVAFARHFPDLDWQPSDPDPAAVASIDAWRAATDGANLRAPLKLDACDLQFPFAKADAVLAINLVHISPWATSVGLLEHASRLLKSGAPLILYGPWIEEQHPTAPSNIEFDEDLKRRNSVWGLRSLGAFAQLASERGFAMVERRSMPANNLMLLFRRH